eukprot:TRINITY_DN277_c0_g1_i6.p1 TRINITY_DN277_c0_g1~~TRINITY_DN277_c0_g1_i6.p1  ORF type:complete len:235 (+),score=54.60 TRINITY_DN277_c0_g1_i6:50-706(+)
MSELDRIRKIDCKMIVLGKSSVGKTTFLNRLIYNEFGKPPQSTIGAAFSSKKWRDKTIGIWDTAGQEKYDSLSKFYYRGASVALLIFDLSDHHSFEILDKYLEALRDVNQGTEYFPVIVGTKYDLVASKKVLREVSVNEGYSYAKEVGASAYFETSSKYEPEDSEGLKRPYLPVEDIFSKVCEFWSENKTSKKVYEGSSNDNSTVNLQKDDDVSECPC